MAVQKIGRFEILRELGKGGQGVVYLARDPQLDRRVAIKTLRSAGQDTAHLLREAQIVSKLQHPNIIPLYDAGEHQGAPYLVYAYIEGQTLAQKLKREKTLPFAQAAEIIYSVLEGIAYAHAQGVMHLDIKPANVMLGKDGRPMVMDFGLAQLSCAPAGASGPINGTPQYMAPERISGKPVSLLADIYSLGVILYEMVTGELAFSGDSVYAVLHRAAHETPVAPSERNEKIDERLEALILKAMHKNPGERYRDASAMRQALLAYLAGVREDGGMSTLEFLLHRMRSKSDFPALSGVISEINRIVSLESESANRLASVILQDFALTNKLLRLVNSGLYGQFGGKINTVTKAVVILGFDTVRNIATTLILLEFMQNKPQSAQLKDEILGAIFSGVVAAQLASESNAYDAEEAMLCSMFHSLGRLLTVLYFFEESEEIGQLVAQGESEEAAEVRVLGLTCSELGVGVARSWNFSPLLLAGMRRLSPQGNVRKPQDAGESMAVTVNLANELCAIAAASSADEKPALLQALASRYGEASPVSPQALNEALDDGMLEMSRRSAILGIGSGKSALLERVRKWSGHTAPEARPKPDDSLDGISVLEQVDEQPPAGSQAPEQSSEEILGAGVQDVTASLIGEYELNDVLQIILETIYRGMGFNRAFLLIRDNKRSAMVARIGFGGGADGKLAEFRFPLRFSADVFHLSIAKGADIVIEDAQALNISDKIPAWYLDSINAPCFMLLPVMVREVAIGLIYADMSSANSLNVSQQQLSLLRTLRNQAVLAIKQKM